MRDSNPRGYETSFAYAQLARSRSPTGLLAARRDGPHTLACGSSSQQRFAETLVDPASPATSEQSPLCDHVFFCLRHKKPPGASLPCSSSPQKVTLRLRCSLVNALTTLRLATNFLRKRARAQLFLSGLQFPYKIPAGEAQRDFPVLSGHRLKSRSALQRRDFPVLSREFRGCETRPS